jgi:hypothetical protein
MEKALLLREVTSGYAALEALIAPLNDEQLTTPGVMGEWTMKDVLAHLTAWHLHLLDLLDAAVQGTTPAPSAVVSTDEEVDRLNAHFYAAGHARPLAEVQAGFGASFERVIADLEALAEEALNRTDQWPWLRGVPLWQFVRGNTYAHYDEHATHIRAWLAR